MSLLFHIIFALGSLVYAGYVMFFPARLRLYFLHGLIIATFISGIFLIISKPAHMVQSCISGLIYLGAVSFCAISARNKLAAANK